MACTPIVTLNALGGGKRLFERMVSNLVLEMPTSSKRWRRRLLRLVWQTFFRDFMLHEGGVRLKGPGQMFLG